MADVLASGHSRIPVFRGSRHNILGYFLVKRLIGTMLL
jgi:CBS domain containing-hemolysin-like protein